MIPFSASVLVESYNVGPLTLHRASAPTQNARFSYDDPTYVTQSLDPVAVHPATARELQRVPEADRHVETIRVYTTERLYVSDGGQAPDRIEWRGRTYRASKVLDYDEQGGAYSTLAQLEEVTA